MLKRLLVISLSTLGLSACVYDNPGSFIPAPRDSSPQQLYYPHQSYEDMMQNNYKMRQDNRERPDTMYDRGNDDRGYQNNNYRLSEEPKKQVVVPETFHMNSQQSAQSHKDRDRRWVEIQNPRGYTIEIAEGNKASDVANKLYRTPANERKAEIHYQQNGSTQYKGLYGSYSSYEAAQNALQSLPDEVKSGAKIKNWSNVQGSLGD